MRKIYFFCIALFMGLFLKAQTVTIGTGASSVLSTSTTATSLQSPYNSYYGYSWVQTIYLQSEISATGNITSIKYNFSGSSLANSNQVKIYMGHVTRSSFASTTDWEPISNLTLVYDGTISGTVPGLVTINLTTPFPYNNTSNLVIAVDENKAGDDGTSGFLASNLGTNRVLFYRSDLTNPDPATPPTAQGRSSFVGNIQINGLTLGCQLPTAVTPASITTNSASVSWTAPGGGPAPAGYEYELRTVGAPGSGSTGLVTGSTTTATTVNLTSLTPATSYSFYIRTNCGGGNFSGWSSAVNLITQCNSVSVPYTESFNGVTTPAIPGCHLVENTNNDATTWRTIASLSGVPAVTSNALAYQYNSVVTTMGANDWFFTPTLNFTTGTSYTLRFKYLASSAPTYTEKLKVQLGSGQSSVSMTGAVLFNNANVNSTSYTQASINFTVASSGSYVLGFNAYSAADQDWLVIDDISVDVTPTCAEPTIQPVTLVTTGSATINWTAPAVAPASYEIYYNTSNIPPTSASTPSQIGITGISQAISGLTSNTTYYAWVRSNCGGTGVSIWSASATFTTDCSPITTFPHTQGFNGSAACWTATVLNGTDNWGLGATSTDISASQTGSGFVYKSYNTSSANLYSAPFNLNSFGSTTGRISFWFYRHASTVAADEAKFYINTSKSTSGATQLIALKPLTTEAPSVPASGWYNYIAPIPQSFNAAGTVYFIIQGTTTAGSSSYDIGVDEFTVEIAPSCVAPTALIATPTATSAAVSWTASTSSPTGGYQWELRTSGAAGSGSTGLFAGGTTAPGVTSDNITGLSANTSYTLYVRSNCGGGDFSAWASISFTTLINCSAGTVLNLCTEVTASIAAGTGSWSFTGTYPTNSVGFSTPGRELIYRFTPATTGVYYLDVTAAPGTGYIDYFYKPASDGCSNTGWMGIDDNNGVGKDAIGMLQAGVEYYILLDAESNTAAPTQTFKICKATTVAPSTLNTCVNAVSPGGSVPANSSKVEYIIDTEGNLIASLDFSTVTNSVGSVTASYYVNGNALRHDGNGREYMDRNFTITTGTAPASPVAVTLYFLNKELQKLIDDPNDGLADVATISNLRVTKTSETCAQSNAVSSGGMLLSPTRTGVLDPAVSYATISVPSFSTFYLHGGSVILPASLLTFSGVRQGNVNQLKWTVAQETDVQNYELERSEDGYRWNKAGTVNSLGNTAAQRSYNFADNNINGTKQMYRLRQVDRNGSEKLSNTIVITGVKPAVLTVSGLFPNPAVTHISLLIDAPGKDNVTIVVIDAVGKVVKTQKSSVETGSNNLQLNVAGLAQGSYVVKVNCTSNCEGAISKFVKE